MIGYRSPCMSASRGAFKSRFETLLDPGAAACLTLASKPL